MPITVFKKVYVYLSRPCLFYFTLERFGDTKGVIRNRNLKKNRQHTDQKKKKKNNDL